MYPMESSSSMYYDTFAESHTASYTRSTNNYQHIANDLSASEDNVLISSLYSSHFKPVSSRPPSVLPTSSSNLEHPICESRPVATESRPNHNPFLRPMRSMKRPFRSILRSSRSLDCLSEVKNRKFLRLPRHPMLQSWRSDQNLPTGKVESSGLLPSPLLSDTQGSDTSESSSSIHPSADSEFVTSHRVAPEACRAQSETQGGSLTFSGADTGNMDFSQDRCVNSGENTTPSVPLSTPDWKATRNFSDNSTSVWSYETDTVCNESWVPSSLSCYEPWLHIPYQDEDSKETNRRNVQIVQQGPARDDIVHLEVASKAKPRIVTITQQLPPAMDYYSPRLCIPSTPDRCCREVSAFSPETPTDTSPSDSGSRTSLSSWEFYSDEERNERAISLLLSDESASSFKTCGGSVDMGGGSSSVSRRDSRPDISEASPSPTSPWLSSCLQDKQLEKSWDHEWTLDQLEHAVNNYPDPSLRLATPVIVFLRKNNEKALLRPFCKIFPGISEDFLDSLCAVLIARIYVVSMSSTQRGESCLCHGDYASSIDVLTKSHTSSSRSHEASPARGHDRTFLSRSALLQKRLDGVLDGMVHSASGRSDEHLKTAILILTQVLETKT